MPLQTLVLIRHAKSDWDVHVSDRERPLAARGRRQAPAAGEWLVEHGIRPDLVLVSPALRARQTWELVAEAFDRVPRNQLTEAVYAFDGEDLVPLLTSVGSDVTTLAMVGHNPALEELVESLTGTAVRMPTSALAVLDSRDGTWGRGSAEIRYAGRPADA